MEPHAHRCHGDLPASYGQRFGKNERAFEMAYAQQMLDIEEDSACAHGVSWKRLSSGTLNRSGLTAPSGPT